MYKQSKNKVSRHKNASINNKSISKRGTYYLFINF
jgi:hypothetical protein